MKSPDEAELPYEIIDGLQFETDPYCMMTPIA
jgi:hypothetical protein